MGGTPASTLGRIVWHDHVSDDVDRATAFYRDVAGWDYDVWEHGGVRYPMIAVGGRSHGGFIATPGGPAGWLPYVRVADVDETAARIGEAGGRVHRAPTDIPEIGRFAVVADPAGAAFTLWAEADDRPPGNEAFAWDEVYTDDPAAAAEFYGSIFGWRTAPFNEGYTIFMNEDATVAGLMKRPEPLPAPAWLTYLTSADVDGAFARARNAGGHPILEPTDIPSVGRVSVLVDPLGAAFGLWRGL